MPTNEPEVTRLYKKILAPVEAIYSEFMASDRYLDTQGKRAPDEPPQPRRIFSDIPLVFGDAPGHQHGIFIGDSKIEMHLKRSHELDENKPAVMINVKEINGYYRIVEPNGLCLLLAHELAHGYRWAMGHPQTQYVLEPWARTLELAYVEALQIESNAEHLGVSFEKTLEFIKEHRKPLYKTTANEKHFYTELSEDDQWPQAQAQKSTKCPVCHKPLKIAMLHVLCATE